MTVSVLPNYFGLQGFAFPVVPVVVPYTPPASGLNLTGDYLIFDDLEPVTWYVRVGPAAPTTGGVTVNNCLRVTSTKAEAGSIGLLGTSHVTWHAWDAELGAIVPRIGDVIKDGQGVRWTVTDAKYDRLVQHWTLEALKEK